MRFSVADYTTAWQWLEVGIVTGCIISIIIFAAAMNLLVKSVEKLSRGPVTESGVKQPPMRAFMNDMTVTTKSMVQGRWMLEDIKRIITWARMRFKPAKSRSLVLKKGKISDWYRFKAGGELVSTVKEQPVKSLGRWFTADINDRKSIKEMVTTAEEWMKMVDKSRLPG